MNTLVDNRNFLSQQEVEHQDGLGTTQAQQGPIGMTLLSNAISSCSLTCQRDEWRQRARWFTRRRDTRLWDTARKRLGG